jgi:enterochelin esterase-like enzyme
VLALGYSLGSEAALLAADYFPQVFHGAIVYSPSSFASPAQNDPGRLDAGRQEHSERADPGG